MPLSMRHIRNGKPVSHHWTPQLLTEFFESADYEGGNEQLMHKGEYTFKHHHTWTMSTNINEETIKPGDKVEAWR